MIDKTYIYNFFSFLKLILRVVTSFDLNSTYSLLIKYLYYSVLKKENTSE